MDRILRAAVHAAAVLSVFLAASGPARADCQDECLAACPKRSGAFGSRELDPACVRKCLLLQCDPVGEIPLKKPPRPPLPDGNIELVLNAGGADIRALSRGEFRVSAAALPLGGAFRWQLDGKEILELRDARAPAQGIFPMPRGGLTTAAASTRTAIPLRPGRVEIAVEYEVGGRKASSKATLDIVPPLLLLHGIASNAQTWDAMKERLERSRLLFGGKLCATCPPPRPADFYTADFRYPQWSYLAQKDDVAAYVGQIASLVSRDARPEGRRVAILAHSMGGLASRAYLQSPAYRKDVAALVTVGTPHRGSLAAQFVSPQEYPQPVRAILGEVIRRYVGLDLSSDGVRELAIVSNDMKTLNSGAAASLPRDVRYVFVVGTLPPETAHEILSETAVRVLGTLERNDTVFNQLRHIFERTDVLVDEGSQNLNTLVPGIGQVIHTKAIHCCWSKQRDGKPLNETEQTDVLLRALAATGQFGALAR